MEDVKQVAGQTVRTQIIYSLTSLRMAGSPDEDQQHAADDEQRGDSNGCQRGQGAALLGVLLLPCQQTHSC